MIPVEPQPEPAYFDAKVRQKGLAFLKKRKIPLDGPLPRRRTLPSYWRECLDDLHARYNGCCAYLAVFIERVTGGVTTDHFVAKSRRPGLAYEWSNFRLACQAINGRKGDFENILDPFTIEKNWFRLELFSGRIFPNPSLSHEKQERIRQTIDVLKLDSPGNRELRTRHFDECITGACSAAFLQRRSPFVYMEAVRQGLLEKSAKKRKELHGSSEKSG